MNGKKEPMMDGRQFHVRVRGVMVLLAAVLVGFLWVLYDLQYVHGAEYLEQSRRKIAKTETVEASRGQILDRYGRVLVGNRASYNVSLDTSFMGEERNAILLRLLEICREESVTWSDTLPVSRSAPYVFTAEGAYGNLRKYAEKMKWDGLVPTAEELEALQSAESPALPSAERLLAKLRETYQVDPALSDGEARDLVGVLYELALRSREITWSSYVFAQDVEMAFIVKVKEASLSGVSIDTTTVREYNTSYAAHLLGRVGLMDSDEWNNIYQALDYPYNASVGKDGMEQAFESYLHGVPGKRAIETNDQGKVVSADDNWKIDERTGEPQAPQPGCNVISTLDIKLQEAVERALADGVGALKSEDTQGAAAVVIDVNDGGVLASASYPTYDLSTFLQNYTELANDPLNPLFNRATQGVYPPGSTFKMVTAIAGLQEGVITPTDEILDTGRYTYYKDYQPQCWYYRQYGRTHGKENVSEAIRAAAWASACWMRTPRSSAWGSTPASRSMRARVTWRVPVTPNPWARSGTTAIPSPPPSARRTTSLPLSSSPTMWLPWPTAAHTTRPTCSRRSNPATSPRWSTSMSRRSSTSWTWTRKTWRPSPGAC